MVYEVLVTEDATEDASSAYEWYEEQLQGLGEEFYQNLLIVFDQLAEYPNTGKHLEYGIRKVLVPTFPFSVYYSVKGSVVRILRILHQSRHPDTWKR